MVKRTEVPTDLGSPDAERHDWPEEEMPREAPPAKLNRRVRIGRFLGDAFLIGGMAKGMTGRAPGADRAATNVILFGEGAANGREANRGSDSN